MPRPQRELDPEGGPLVELARELRAVREAAGTPKFATMSRRTGRSKTALAEAAGGRHLPRWETVEDFVRACDADPRTIRARWDRARRAITVAAPETREAPPAPVAADDPSAPAASGPAAEADAGVPVGGSTEPATSTEPAATAEPATVADASAGATPAAPSPRPAADPGPAASDRPRRRAGLGLGVLAGLAGAAVVLLVLSLTGIARWSLPGSDRPPVVTQDLRVVEIQNKVAIGPDRLVEDSTPAYLSAVPVAYCASPSRSCKVPGTEMGSGVALVANCQVVGQRMVNFDLLEDASRTNRHRADSDLWYRATFPDGRTGYISEVYISPDNRGGMGLPTCGPPPPAPTTGARAGS